MVLTQKGVFLVGREVQKSGPNKGQSEEVVSRHIQWSDLYQVSLSTRQDDFVILHVTNEYDSLLQVPFKAEMVTVMSRIVKAKCNKDLKMVFSDK